MLYIIAIHLEGGDQHEHITKVKWQNENKSDTSTKEQMISWINQGNKAYVTDGVKTVDVLVVNATPPYLRTYADGRWTNNLLALTRF
jgi:hypothetical protein